MAGLGLNSFVQRWSCSRIPHTKPLEAMKKRLPVLIGQPPYFLFQN